MDVKQIYHPSQGLDTCRAERERPSYSPLSPAQLSKCGRAKSDFSIRWIVLGLALTCLPGCSAGPAVTGDISALRDFAVAYEPKPKAEGLFATSLPTPPPEVVSVLEHHPVDDEYCRNVTLVIVKLFRYHIENHGQGYDLRDEDFCHARGTGNPFVVAFAGMARVGDEWDTKHLDYLGSDMIIPWIDLHGYEFRDKRIGAEMRRIRTVHDRVLAELEQIKASHPTP